MYTLRKTTPPFRILGSSSLEYALAPTLFLLQRNRRWWKIGKQGNSSLLNTHSVPATVVISISITSLHVWSKSKWSCAMTSERLSSSELSLVHGASLPQDTETQGCWIMVSSLSPYHTLWPYFLRRRRRQIEHLRWPASTMRGCLDWPLAVWEVLRPCCYMEVTSRIWEPSCSLQAPQLLGPKVPEGTPRKGLSSVDLG